MYPSQTVENIKKNEWLPKAKHCKQCILPIYLDIIQLEEMNQIVAHIAHEKN